MNDFLTYLLIGIAVVTGLIFGLLYVQSFTYTISGNVFDFEGKPIENADVIFSGNYSSTITNADGHWSKEGLKGTVSVDIIKAGWKFTPPVKVNGKRNNVDFFGIQQRVSVVLSIGKNPRNVAIDTQNGKGYVTLSGENAVGVFDLSNYRIIANINVGMTPWGIVVDKSNDEIYVTNFGANTVTVIDGKNDKVISNIKVGNEPLGIAVDEKTNRIYVANNLDNTLSIIDGATDRVIGTVDVGRSPSAVAINEKDDLIYVANSEDNTVSILNGKTEMITNTLNVGVNPSAVAIDYENGMVYVLNVSDGSVSIINNSAVIGTINLSKGVDNIFFDPSVFTIYVTDAKDDSLIFINAKTKSVVKSLPVGDKPFGIAVNVVSNQIYVTNYGNGTLSVVD